MNVSELIDYAKERPVLAGGVALASVASVALVWWQGRGEQSPLPVESLGIVGDLSTIPDGYPGVIVNQPATPTPTPTLPAPATGTELGFVIRDGKRVGIDKPVGSSVTCPSGYVAAKRKDGTIVCTRQTDVGADLKRYLWFLPGGGRTQGDLKSQYR